MTLDSPPMIFRFLGTGSAWGAPSVWCTCPHCKEARKLGGRNIRGQSCASIAPNILIDIPAELRLQAPRFGVDLSCIEHLLITHSHGDHFFPELLLLRRSEYKCSITGNTLTEPHMDLPTLNVYGNSKVIDGITAKLSNDIKHCSLKLHTVECYRQYDAGGFAFIPLLSSHIVPGEKPLNYIIHKDGRCVLYACDSFRFSPETWHAICDHRYDLVVIECSRGDADSNDENDINARAHLNFEQGIEMYKEFVQADLLTDKGVFAFSHLSHHAGSHDEAAARLARHRITIAYDGMKLEL